ncbi:MULTISPECIES: hypothetical protein [unclassified Chryseobacterium]|uniref:hypothetical protein n=1 Tax=unclassified Chryseobacterium TaxID=2593645 RepID=UPI00100AE4BD|nr:MULTISPECIES: hypothetical protein [unclassified Chryseobacterium]RXM52881.1 hypothetical protein BOQ64_00155 [Chryseobacterium sp. CH25]RXM65926.1 hypothetical protein BOQ60_09360 [Chryseobacterium sp. CH1]
MKTSILTLFTCIAICSCNAPKEKVVYTKDFLSENPKWQISNNTTNKEFEIGFEDRKEPMKISWTTAKDQTGCLRIASLTLENVNSKSQLKIENIKTSKLECAMKFDSPDTTRFETLIVSADYSTFKNIKEYTYRGPIITIMGNGESKVTKE